MIRRSPRPIVLHAAAMLAAAALTVALVPGGFDAARAASVLRIGVFGTFTGPVADIGTQMANGAILAIEQANAKGIVIGGQSYQAKVFKADDQARPEVGISVAHQLLDVDKIDIGVGYSLSQVFLRTQDLFQEARVPFIDAAATAGYTGTIKKHLDYVFQVSPRNVDVTYAVAETVQHYLKPTAIAQLNENTDGGRGFGQAVLAWYKKNAPNVRIVYDEYVAQGTTEFSPELTKIKASGAQVTLMEVLGVSASAYFKQWYELRIPVLNANFGSTISASDFIEKYKKELNLTIVNNRWWPGPFTALSEPMYRAYRERFHDDPTSFSVQGYDAALVAIEGLKIAGTVSDRKAVRDAIAGHAFTTVWGIRKFTPVSDGQVAPVHMVVVQIQNGQKVPIWPLDLAAHYAKFTAPPPWPWGQ